MPRELLLIIDDDDDIREIASLTLELTEGWSVIAARCGIDGIELARLHNPAAILLDVMMPGMDGPDTLTMLRAGKTTQKIPVIFMTAKIQAADRRRFLDLGVEGLIAKPFDPMTLGLQVRELLKWAPLDAAEIPGQSVAGR